MAHYNSCRILQPRLTLFGVQKEVSGHRLNRPVQNGFEFRDWPVVKYLADKKDFDINEIHWEYIPEYIHDEFELREARIMNSWLLAKGESLFKNERGYASNYREGALYGRCLVLSSGFFEWRHIPVIGKRGKPLGQTEKIPYYITLKSKPEYFFMAGVSRIWTNHTRSQSADSFAIVTTEANQLMSLVNNEKKRMPVIFNEDLALKWLTSNLSENEIYHLANYKYDTKDMIAWPVEKGFINKSDPDEEFQYDNLPAL